MGEVITFLSSGYTCPGTGFVIFQLSFNINCSHECKSGTVSSMWGGGGDRIIVF